MFKYAVRVARNNNGLQASLVDWPDVTVVERGDPLSSLQSRLISSIEENVRSRKLIPLPKAKPTSAYVLRLYAPQAMKVIVLNEIISAGFDLQLFARRMGLEEAEVEYELSLSSPADIAFLDLALCVLDKRLVAYATSA